VACGNTEVSRATLKSPPAPLSHSASPPARGRGPHREVGAARLSLDSALRDVERASTKAAVDEAVRKAEQAVAAARRGRVHDSKIQAMEAQLRRLQDAARRRNSQLAGAAAGTVAIHSYQVAYETLASTLGVTRRSAREQAKAAIRLRRAEALRLDQIRPNSAYRQGACMWETDPYGNTARASGVLSLAPGAKRAPESTRIGKQGYSTDEGGHLIATRFGGARAAPNVVPMASALNRGEWILMENTWAAALRQGQTVHVDIQLIRHDAEGIRPDGIQVDFTIDGESMTRFFPND
jgi:hypothetical protein